MKRNLFVKFSSYIAHITGQPATFTLAAFFILVWVITGPFFGFSDSWQLVINTTTTIVTFLMVFLIQSTQNRDTVAIQLKLDELIRATEKAHNALLDIEELSEEELVKIRKNYEKIAATARSNLRQGKLDIGVPEIESKIRKKKDL
ncbi:low affinity iron permease family protein [Candidatus Woesearchaeota archaeon]|nr:low affinity iron permease family protein [Candidatus Woesearchaeota archaeon]